MRKAIILAAVGLLGFACYVQAAPALYHLTPVGSNATPTGINASGQITGYVRSTSFLTTATGTINDPGAMLDGFSARATAINNSGQLTGIGAFADAQSSDAFRTAPNGVVADPMDLGITIVLEGVPGSVGVGINSSGQVAANSAVARGGAFRTTATGTITDGTATSLGVLTYSPNVMDSTAYGINDSGQITGNSGSHAFRTSSSGTLSDPDADLGLLAGQIISIGTAINASGQVAGYASRSGNQVGFRTTATGTLTDGTVTILPALGGGGLDFQPLSINDFGVVVGKANTPPFIQNVGELFHGFYFDSATYDLNDYLDSSGSGWLINSAVGINNSGQIAAIATAPNGVSWAVRLTPVPEPAIVALAPLFSLLVRRRRRLHAGKEHH